MPESAAPQDSGSETTSRTRRILQRIRLDEPTIDRVCRIVGSCQTGGALDTNEFRTVWDADTLANLSAENCDDRCAKLENLIEHGLKTDAGKEKARDLLHEIRREHKGE